MSSWNVDIFRGNSLLKSTWNEEVGTCNGFLYRSFYGPPEGTPKYLIRDGQYVGQYWNLKTVKQKEAFR